MSEKQVEMLTTLVSNKIQALQRKLKKAERLRHYSEIDELRIEIQEYSDLQSEISSIIY